MEYPLTNTLSLLCHRSNQNASSLHMRIPQPVLNDAIALVVGIANEHSIAYGCAKAFRELGADLAMPCAWWFTGGQCLS